MEYQVLIKRLLKEFKGNKQVIGLLLSVRGDSITDYIKGKSKPSKKCIHTLYYLVNLLDSRVDKRILLFEARKSQFLREDRLILLYLMEKNGLRQKDIAQYLDLKIAKIQRFLESSSMRNLSKEKYNQALTLFTEKEVKDTRAIILKALEGRSKWRHGDQLILLTIQQYLEWKPEFFQGIVAFNPFNIFSQGKDFELKAMQMYKEYTFFNATIVSEDLEEYTQVDAFTIKPELKLIEFKDTIIKDESKTNRWRSGYLRKVVEELWVKKKIYSFTSAEIVISSPPSTINKYAKGLGIEIKTLADDFNSKESQNYNLSLAQLSILENRSYSYFWKQKSKGRPIPNLNKINNPRDLHKIANLRRAKNINNKDYEKLIVSMKVPEIVYQYKAPKNGQKFEEMVNRLVEEKGYKTYRNVGLLDKDTKLRTTKYPEIDIFALKETEKVIIQCSSNIGRKNGHVRGKYNLLLNSLFFLKEILKVKAIFAVGYKISPHAKKIAERRGIIIWELENKENYIPSSSKNLCTVLTT